MVIIWLRNWFPVQSAFCLPQRLTDSCLKCNEKWQLLFAFFTDSLTQPEFLFLLSGCPQHILCPFLQETMQSVIMRRLSKRGQEAFLFCKFWINAWYLQLKCSAFKCTIKLISCHAALTYIPAPNVIMRPDLRMLLIWSHGRGSKKGGWKLICGSEGKEKSL